MLSASTLLLRILAAGLCDKRGVIGASEYEIKLIEDQLNVRLPSDYRSFLEAVGKSAGRFWDDCDFQLEKLAALQERAAAILDNWEEGKLVLPKQAFVFTMRQGEQFMFFENVHANAPYTIYFYFEGRGCFEPVAECFWDAIDSELREFESFIRSIRQ